MQSSRRIQSFTIHKVAVENTNAGTRTLKRTLPNVHLWPCIRALKSMREMQAWRTYGGAVVR
jgi:hypothetical protein